MRRSALVLVALAAGCLDTPPDVTGPGEQHSLQLFGQPYRDNGIDRVWIPAHGSPAGKLGRNNFTVEMWLKGEAADFPFGVCGTFWFENTILLDREFFTDPPQDGNIGMSVYQDGSGSGVVAGFEIGDIGEVTLCGDVPVLDGEWHHVAVTRSPADVLSLWIDGQLDDQKQGPIGSGGVEAVGGDPADRYLVVGGPKQEVNTDPGFVGLIDDLRLLDDDIYQEPFDRPYPPLAVVPDDTLALYSFDEGAGTEVINRAAPGDGDGELRVGGDPPGPAWSDDVPAP